MCSADQTCTGPPDPTRIFTREHFGHGLTCLRTRAGLTVRQVARRAVIPTSTLNDYFKGHSLPRVDALRRILKVCGVADENNVMEWEKAKLRTGRGRPEGNPYRGLEFFRSEDAGWFFGRERLTSTLVGELAGRYSRGGPLVVIGVSGSGKSSLLRAGLIPALRRGDLGLCGSTKWLSLLFTPGNHPLTELATQLALVIRERQATQLDPVIRDELAADIKKMLWSDPRTAADFARQACGAGDTPSAPPASSPGPGCGLVVVVDQFEEVFTSCLDEAERSAFIAALGAAAGSCGEPTDTASGEPSPPAALVVLGLRADFYSQALQRADLLPALQGHVVVGPMTKDELRDTIVKPAEKAGIGIEDGLVELLLRDLRPGPGVDETPYDRTERPDSPAHEAGALPLLSHALDVTWRRLRRAWMTVAEYEEGGGIRGALEQTAAEAHGELTTQQQQTARQLFLRLVHIAEGTADTRRRVSHAELFDSDGGHTRSEDLKAVLKQFVDRRLITECRDYVEIAHDALLSAWPRLREWIKDDRANLVIIRRLIEDADAWEAKGRERGRLYRGSQLALAEQAGSASLMPLARVARNFLKASIAAQRRWAYVRTALVAVMAILLVFSATAALMAYQAKGDRREDISRALAHEAATLRVKEPYFSLLLAIEAYRIAPTNAAINSLRDFQRAYQMLPLACSEQTCHTDAVVAVRWVKRRGDERRSNANGVLMTAGRDGKLNVWITSSEGSRPVHDKVFDHGSPIQTAAISPDGTTVASAGLDHSIHVWDVNSGSKIHEFEGGKQVNGIAFHPEDSNIVATAEDDGVVSLWNFASGEHVVIPADNGHLPVSALAFSPDSGLLATAHGDGKVKLWEVSGLFSPYPEPFISDIPHGAPVRVLAFRPDSEKLVIGVGADVLICETAKERLKKNNGLTCLTSEGDRAGQVQALIFSPGVDSKGLIGGNELLVAADDASVRLLDTANRAIRSFYTGLTGNVLDVAFSPDGKSIAAGGSDGTVGLWDVRVGLNGEARNGGLTENREQAVIDWVCAYYPAPVLPRWPESIPAEFRREIC